MPEQQDVPQQQMSEEQIKALQEKLKQMSPEELKEFQKKQCIFCQIIAGKVQAKRVYEDENVLAILDINPANPGHVLIMPKEHYSIMPQIPEDEVGHIFMVAKAMSNASLRALEVQGSNILVANGVAAGQRAQHFMVHMIPRKENDNINFQLPQKNIPEEELKSIRKLLSESLGAKTDGDEEQIAPIPVLPQKKKVVDAEFKEKREPVEKKKLTKKPEKKETKEEIKENKAENGEGVNLDDIANLFGVK